VLRNVQINLTVCIVCIICIMSIKISSNIDAFLIISDEAFLSYSGGILNNCLTNILHINENETDINEQQIIYRSSYYDLDQFSKLADENKNSFIILSTNIQSINAKFSELKAFVDELNIINFKFSVICLQETWIDESEDISPFHLQGYDCIHHGKTFTCKGGLIIYIDNQYKSKVTYNLNTYEHLKGLVVKVQSNLSKTFTIGNIYIDRREREMKT